MRLKANSFIYTLLVMSVFVLFVSSWVKFINNGGHDVGVPMLDIADVIDINQTTAKDEKSSDARGTFIDSRDGNLYGWVKIDNQIWMAENLRYLPSVSAPNVSSNNKAYYYVYDYNGTDVNAAIASANYTTYGVLYNWTAACVSCPTGWHLPSDEEWTALTDFVVERSGDGGKLKETGTTHWNSPNIGATNETGFTALPGGIRLANARYWKIGSSGYWWSATEYNVAFALDRVIHHSNTHVSKVCRDKNLGLSVRCIKD